MRPDLRAPRPALRAPPSAPRPLLLAPSTGVLHTPHPRTITFEIRDSGPGIAEEDLPHIFDRFYRADRARARETGGSGLGLAIVQRLVEAHGGAISVSSRPGQGATFRVELPAA